MSDEEGRIPRSGLARPLSRPARWRREIGDVLESAEFHWTIIGLTLADAVFVVSEICWDLLVRDDCSEEAREEPPFIEMASYLSIIITCCFLVEIPLAFFAFGIKYYKHFLHLFDAVVVIVTFVLEVALHLTTAITVSSEEYHETAEQREIVRLKRKIEGLKEELQEERSRRAGSSDERDGAGRSSRTASDRRSTGGAGGESEGDSSTAG